MTALMDMARGIDQPSHKDGSVGLVVDIGADGLAKMERHDAQAYLDRLSTQLGQMRDQGTPVVWIQMGPENALHQVRPGADGRQNDPAQLKELGFMRDGRAPGDNSPAAVEQDTEAQQMMDSFMAAHGPKAGDTIATKYFKSPFMKPADYQGEDRAGLRASVAADYDTAKYPLPGADAFQGPDLVDHLRQEGLTKPIIMGGMSNHCITEAAVDGRWKGFDTKVASDLVISWEDPNAGNRPEDRIIWREGFSDPDAANAFHAGRVQDAASDIQSVAAQRDMPDAVATSLSTIPIGSSDTLIAQAKLDNPASLAAHALHERRVATAIGGEQISAVEAPSTPMAQKT